MLDLLPLRQCFAARSRTPPAELSPAMQRDAGHAALHAPGRRHARALQWHGASRLPPDWRPSSPTTTSRGQTAREIDASRYVRLERAGAVLIMDVGSPPPLEAAGEAHAGCLSFEFSAGTRLVFANGGAPGPANSQVARGLARDREPQHALPGREVVVEAHSPQGARGSGRRGPHPLSPMSSAPASRSTADNLEVTAHHDGYVERFGLIHRRTIVLGRHGPPSTRSRPARASPSQHPPADRTFPLPSISTCIPTPCAGAARAATSPRSCCADGEVWRFSLEGARLSLEEGTFFRRFGRPAQRHADRGARRNVRRHRGELGRGGVG